MIKLKDLITEVKTSQEILKHMTGGTPSRVGNLTNMGNYK